MGLEHGVSDMAPNEAAFSVDREFLVHQTKLVKTPVASHCIIQWGRQSIMGIAAFLGLAEKVKRRRWRTSRS